MTTTNTLFDPITLRGLTAPHRLWVAPMCQYSAAEGLITAWHRTHLGSFAIGRAGLIITEATAISPRGRVSPWDAGLWSDEHRTAWREVTTFAASQGVPMAVQLSHAGRKGSVKAPFHDGPHSLSDTPRGWETMGPSAIAFGDLHLPHEMSTDDIGDVLKDFVASSKYAVAAGFAAIELHAAHGYLLHQFLSPLANQRQDSYGGHFDNRIRLTMEITERIRQVIPETMPLFVRISATDWVEGGWTLDESVELSKRMALAGVDFVDVSTGGLDASQQVTPAPGYQKLFARAIKEQVSIAVGTVGLITTPTDADEAITDGTADVVLMARQFLREPTFALRAAKELQADISWPPQYDRARVT